jgi:hypothetical protein
MATILDAGALIALERNRRELWVALKAAALAGEDVLVPSTVIAQVWRNRPTQARLSQALRFCVAAPFDDVAPSVGILCGESRTTDICDAHVAIIARKHGGVVYTSDPDDLAHLLGCSPGRRTTIVRC